MATQLPSGLCHPELQRLKPCPTHYSLSVPLFIIPCLDNLFTLQTSKSKNIPLRILIFVIKYVSTVCYRVSPGNSGKRVGSGGNGRRSHGIVTSMTLGPHFSNHHGHVTTATQTTLVSFVVNLLLCKILFGVCILDILNF